MGILSIALLAGCARSEPPERAGQAVYVGAELLREYDPQPALVVPQHPTTRPRYPAIDIHCHWSMQQDPQALLKAMDELGLARAVNLSGGWGTDLDRMLQRFHDAAPDRLLIFCNVDFSRIDEPGFADRAVQELGRARAAGAAGLKVFKSLGLTTRDANGRVIAIDDPRLDPIWQACGELRMPVLIHSADPVAFFQPIDARNERWMQLKRHPDWSFASERFPPRQRVLEQRNRVIERHGQTVFIGAHVAENSEDLAAAGRLLERLPNLYVDISGRVGELGRQPYSARDFLIRYQDRVLFGTDRYPGRPDQPRNAIYYRFLETRDEYFKYYEHPFPPEGEWRIYGVGLPDGVLKKIYRENAERALAGGLPAAASAAAEGGSR